MSNVITGNPIICDTASATAVIVSNAFRCQAILWDPGTSAANADVLAVTDKNGVVKFAQTLLTGNLVPPPIAFETPVLFDGLKVTAMTHGKVYIYLADSNNLSA